MATSKNLSNLVINKIDSQAVYDYMKATGLVNEDELYLVNDTSGGSVDINSINGLDTYLANNGYIRFATGSYIGDTDKSVNTSYTFPDVSSLKSKGRKITLPFAPSVLYINNKTLYQGGSLTTTYTLTDTSWTKCTYYSACLDGNILYVAHAGAGTHGGIVADNSDTSYGFNFLNKTYQWEIASAIIF